MYDCVCARVMDTPPGSLQTLLSALHTHLLECKVCMETFSFSTDEEHDRRPMILCCGHVLCAECLRLLTATFADRSSADGQTLHCPFCRLPSDQTQVSLCRPVSDLQELLLEHESSTVLASALPPAGLEMECRCNTPRPGQGSLQRTTLRLVRAFGGWGTLVNPTALALFRSGALAVVHDGKARVVVFGPQGRRLHAFGRRGGRGASDAGAGVGLTHPLGVAVLPGGQVVVSDAGDSTLKVLTSRGGAVAETRDWLLLPWGVCVSADGGMLVADERLGALVRLEVEASSGTIRGCRVILGGLQNPRAIACCPLTGHIAVVEYLQANTHTSQHISSSPEDSKDTHTPGHIHTRMMSTRLRLYSSGLTLLCQIDSLSLGLCTGSPTQPLYLSAVTFDLAGHLVAADAHTGVVWSLGRLWEEGRVTVTPLVRDGLVRPVGLAVTGDTLVVLDSGDHSVKMYSRQTA